MMDGLKDEKKKDNEKPVGVPAERCYTSSYLYLDFKTKEKLFVVISYNYDQRREEEFVGSIKYIEKSEKDLPKYDKIALVTGDGSMIPIHRTRACVILSTKETNVMREVVRGIRIGMADTPETAKAEAGKRVRGTDVIRVRRGEYQSLRTITGHGSVDEEEALSSLGLRLNKNRIAKSQKKKKSWWTI